MSDEISFTVRLEKSDYREFFALKEKRENSKPYLAQMKAKYKETVWFLAVLSLLAGMFFFVPELLEVTGVEKIFEVGLLAGISCFVVAAIASLLIGRGIGFYIVFAGEDCQGTKFTLSENGIQYSGDRFPYSSSRRGGFVSWQDVIEIDETGRGLWLWCKDRSCFVVLDKYLPAEISREEMKARIKNWRERSTQHGTAHVADQPRPIKKGEITFVHRPTLVEGEELFLLTIIPRFKRNLNRRKIIFNGIIAVTFVVCVYGAVVYGMLLGLNYERDFETGLALALIGMFLATLLLLPLWFFTFAKRMQVSVAGDPETEEETQYCLSRKGVRASSAVPEEYFDYFIEWSEISDIGEAKRGLWLWTTWGPFIPVLDRTLPEGITRDEVKARIEAWRGRV